MPVHEADAIVLRQYALSDSDRILICFTREYGKVRAVAQGIKKLQSRMAGCLEPLNHVQIEFWTREGKELGQIRRAELVHSFWKKKPDLRQIYAFSYFAEISHDLVQENQPNPALFRLLLAALAAGEHQDIAPALVRYFELWALKLNGLLPNYAYCSNCGKCVKDEGFFAWIEAGQTRCAACAQHRGVRIGAAASAALEEMMKLPPEKFMVRPLAEDAGADIERLSQRLLGLHLEKQLKSYRILREVLQG